MAGSRWVLPATYVRQCRCCSGVWQFMLVGLPHAAPGLVRGKQWGLTKTRSTSPLASAALLPLARHAASLKAFSCSSSSAAPASGRSEGAESSRCPICNAGAAVPPAGSAAPLPALLLWPQAADLVEVGESGRGGPSCCA